MSNLTHLEGHVAFPTVRMRKPHHESSMNARAASNAILNAHRDDPRLSKKHNLMTKDAFIHSEIASTHAINDNNNTAADFHKKAANLHGKLSSQVDIPHLRVAHKIAANKHMEAVKHLSAKS